MTHTADSIVAVDLSVARQAIFDHQRRLWGYEIYCVGNSADSPTGLPSSDGLPIRMAASAGMGLQQIVAKRKRVLVGLTEKNILDDQAYALPPGGTSILVGEQVYGRPGVAARLEQLKVDGFTLAVPSFSADPALAHLYDLAEVLGVDVRRHSRDELAARLDSARHWNAGALAVGVADLKLFTMCQELGFELFQGSFSKLPEVVALRKVSSNKIVRLNLLKALDAGEPDIPALAKKLETDAALTFRLLTHLNSAAYGLSHKVKSVTHAISLLGWRQVRNWLRVVLLSDVAQDAANPELLPVSAQRARFLELVAERFPFWGFAPDSMHLLGLFSLLDAMVGVPMSEIVTYLPLEGGLKAALCREPGNEYLPLLELAQLLEEARWKEAEDVVVRLNLDSMGIRAAFQEAVEWAGELSALMDA